MQTNFYKWSWWYMVLEWFSGINSHMNSNCGAFLCVSQSVMGQVQQNMEVQWCVKPTSTIVLTGTHYSCISWVGAGTSKVVNVLVTFSQVTLCSCTIQIVIPGGTTSSSKGSISESFQCSWVAQLMAHNCSIIKVPVVVTHSAPLAKEKDLNTTFQQSIPSHQSYRAFRSWVICCYIYGNTNTEEMQDTVVSYSFISKPAPLPQ